MSQIRTVHTRRVIVILVLLLVVSSVVILSLRDVIREVIVIPISYLLFVAGILIDTTPQVFFWISILLITFWIAYRSMSSKQRRTPPSIRPITEDANPRHPFSGRVANWAVKVSYMRKYNSSYYRGTFHQSLIRLLVELLAHRYRLTTLQVEERLRNGMLDVPPMVRDYYIGSMGRSEPVRIGFFAKTWKAITYFLRVWITNPFRIPTLENQEGRLQSEAQIACIIQYMEEELEITHDYSSK